MIMQICLPAVADRDGDPWFMPAIPQESRHELLPYADHPVALHERVLLLACLDEYGSLPVAGCLHVLRGSDNSIAVLAALILKGVIAADLEAGPLDPSTRVRRAEFSPLAEREGRR
jgi:hypothetical protein